jgi:hypothetical protein
MTRTISFEDLFHAGYRLDATELVKGLAARNELEVFARGALLEELLFQHLSASLPSVSEEEIQGYFDKMRDELDYGDSVDRTERWLEKLGMTLEEAATWIGSHLRVQKFIDLYIAERVRTDPDPIIRHLFVTMALRAQLVRVAGVGVLAKFADGEPTPIALEAARHHLASRHATESWKEVETRLTAWGIDEGEIAALVRLYAEGASLLSK